MATNLEKFIIVLYDNKNPEYKSPDKIVGKRAREIKVVLDIQKGYVLAIRTPTFIQYIDPDTIITDLCHKLIKEDPFDFSYTLQVIPKSEKNTIHFILHNEVDNEPQQLESPRKSPKKSQTENSLEIDHDDKHPTFDQTEKPQELSSPRKSQEFDIPPQMPDFIVSFNLNEYGSKSGKYVLRKIVNSYQLSIENPELYINNKKVDFTKHDAKYIIKKLRFDQNDNVFKCHLTEDAIKIMKKRVYPLKELIETEEVFLERVNFLINYFKPRMKEAGLLEKSSDMYDRFFNICIQIFKFHTRFYTSLKSMKINYGTRISFSFIKMGNEFLKHRDFPRQYGNIQKVISEIVANEKLLEIEQKVFSNNKIAFDQYASAPYQRPLKYPLLLHEIQKVTPMSHIDYRFVCIAESTMKTLGQKIEKYCDQIKNAAQMIQISNRIMDSEVSFASMERSLKSSYECKVRTKNDWEKKKQGMIYLLTDKILCTLKTSNKSESVLFYKNIKNLQFIISADKDPESIFFIISTQFYCNILFDSKEMKHDFVLNIRQLRQNLMILEPNQIFAEEIIPTSFTNLPIPQIIGSSTVTLNDTLMFITGGSCLNENEITYPPILSFDSKGNEFSINEINPPFTGMKMTYSKAIKEKAFVSLYMFGGRKCNQVYLYKDNQWVALPNKSSFTRVNHTMVAYNDNLVVFGGLDQQNSESNEIWIYNVTKHQWSKPFIKRKCPSPRSDHSAVVYKNSMIIHGGQLNNEKLNDTWIFSFDQNEWAKIKLHKNNSIVPRCSHGAVMINQFMVVFGGEGYNNLPFALNIDSLDVIDLKIKGNYIYGMNRFAATAVIDSQNLNEKQIICFGGFTNDSSRRIAINSFTRFYLPECIKKPDQIPSDEKIQLEIGENQVKLIKTKSNMPAITDSFLPPVDASCFI